MNLSMRLFKRKNKSGKLVWYIEFDRSSRRSTGCMVGQDDAEAHRIFSAAKKEYLAGKLAHLTGQPARVLLSDFFQEYLEHGARMNKSRATLRMDRISLEKFIHYAGARVRLTDITMKMVEQWRDSLDMKPVSKNTYFRHLKAALSKAVDWDYIKSNPCLKIKKVREDELPPRCLTAEETTRLLTAEDDPRFRLLWEFILATGARRSEVVQITVEDIDRERGLILIKKTKGRKARHLLITPEVADILERLPVQVGRLFPWRVDTLSHHFQRAARRAGIKARLHDLRHTYGTNTACQVYPFILQKLMGHADIKTTQRYIHLSMEDLAMNGREKAKEDR
jgi:integrase